MRSDPPASVLVADDEPRLLQLMQHLLAQRGWEVVAAGDGSEALRAFAASQERLVAAVLDASLPPAGAGAVAEALRDTRPDLGIVVVGGGLRSDAEPEIFDRPGVLWLAKPFPAEALARAVAEVAARLQGDGASPCPR